MEKRKHSSRHLLITIFFFVIWLSNSYTNVFAVKQEKSHILPKGIERITSVEGITEYRLANGLKVLLFPDQSQQTTTVNITYLVGSRNENYGETGMAHLLEHLMFKGSTKHPNIPQELTEHGARPNGSTNFDRTNYFETFQATDQNLEWALDLEADRMVNSFIAKKDLDSEMTVVRNEFEMGENNPNSILFERVMANSYLWHNYGNSPIGAKADLENVPIERLQSFWRTYYQPDNAVLVVAGKFDEAKTLELVNQKFGPIPRPSRVIQKTYTTDPTQDGERFVTLRRTGDVQAVCALYHIPAGSHPDHASIDVLTSILGDTPSGRLYKTLVEPKKASITQSFNMQLKEPGIICFFALVRKEDSLDEASKILLQTVEEITSKPITKEEVDRAKTQLIKNIELTLNSSEQIGIELSEWAAIGDWRLLFLHRDRIEQVKVEDVQRVAEKYLKQSNRTLGHFIPTTQPNRSEIPPTPDIAEILKDYKGKAAIAEGEIFDPSPANIDNRTIHAQIPPGLNLVMLPKKTRGAKIVAKMALHFGDEKSLMNKMMAGEFVAEMLMRGSIKYTRQQIQDELDRLKATIQISGKATEVNISIETIRENFPAVIKLLADILRQPTFPKSEFDQLKQEFLTVLEDQRSEPEAIAQINLQRHLNPYPKNDVRYVMTIDEQIAAIKSLTLDEVKKFYADFYGASKGDIAVIGDFDDKEVHGLIGSSLGMWESRIQYKEINNPYSEIAPTNQQFETPDKANAMFMAGMLVKIDDMTPDYPVLVLANYMLGGGFLNSRLATRIRQNDGLSYAVRSRLILGSRLNPLSPIQPASYFTAYAICAPQNVGKVETAFKEELARILKDGFTIEEVNAAKSGLIQERQVSRANDSELVQKLTKYSFLHRTISEDAGFEKTITESTPEEILTVMRKYIDPTKISIFKAGNFTHINVSPTAK